MAEIRQALAQCFKELMKEKSFQKIIVKDITDRANVKRPTFYTYFRDKYDVVEWIFMQEIRQPANSLIAAGYIREGLRFMLISMEKDKRYYRKLAALEGQNSFVEMMENVVQELILQRMNKEKLSEKITYTWLSLDMIAQYYAHMACSVAVKWINGGMQVPIPELVEVYVIMAQKSMIEIIS